MIRLPVGPAAERSGAIRVDGAGPGMDRHLRCREDSPAAMAQHLGATLVDDTAASLDEIFVAHATSWTSSPTTALLWEIWRQHRWTVVVIVGLTAAWLASSMSLNSRAADAGIESSPLVTLLAMVAFLLLFGVFNYTDSSGRAGGRRFSAPAVHASSHGAASRCGSVLAGITSIELLYLLWMGPLSRGGSVSAPFVAVLLAAFGRVLPVGALDARTRRVAETARARLVAVALFAIGLLPSFPPTPPPPWRSEIVRGKRCRHGLAVVVLLAWHHVARLRAGGRSAIGSSLSCGSRSAAPTRRRAFANAAAAHFWFEWRSSGMVLPVLVVGIVLLRHPADLVVRATDPPARRIFCSWRWPRRSSWHSVGMAFCKPAFWSEDLDVPAFVAVRPLSSAELVAIKVKVAAVSAALSWWWCSCS